MKNRSVDDSLWRATARETVNSGVLSGDVSADIAIIGGGFTGCSAALEAARGGADVVLLEADTIGFGGSGRNVGLVNAGLWMPPDKMIAQLGEAQAHKLIDILGQAPDAVFEIIARHEIACEATRAGTLHLAHGAAGLDDLQARYRQGNRFGAPLKLLDRDETKRRVGSDAYHGALFDPRAGTIQPLAYCLGLARASQECGARIFEHSGVSALAHDNGQWRISANGHTVQAKGLLLATNAYHADFAGIAAPQFSIVHYSQFATGPLSEDVRRNLLPGGEGCWDTALVMSSLRLDQAGRLIFGFMGQLDGLGGDIHTRWAKRALARLFPALGAVEFEHGWQGKIAMTADKVPKVVTLGPNGYAVFGYSGRGIGPGTVFGKAAANALVTGTSEAFAVPVQHSHAERFTKLKSAYYELGATAHHAVT